MIQNEVSLGGRPTIKVTLLGFEVMNGNQRHSDDRMMER